MSNQIRLKRGSGSSPSASDLVVGEVALRTDTGQLFTKKDDGNVEEIGAQGGIADGDKGDITVSNTGTTFTIDNGVVNGPKIASGSISNAKLATASVSSTNIIDGTIVNADINASAAIAGTKISPDFGSQNIVTTATTTTSKVSINSTTPTLEFNESDGNPDYRIFSEGGAYTIQNLLSGTYTTVFKINSDGHTDIIGNLDCAAGLDVTGNITGTGDLTLTSTDAGASAAPIIELYRNSATPADADYIGQLKFTGEDDVSGKVLYGKITGKIDDQTDGTEDGLIEFALRKAGSNNIGARLTSTDFKLINGTGLEVAGGSTLLGNGGASVSWGDTSALGHLSFTATDGNPIVRALTGKDLVFQVNQSTTAMTLLSNGNVSIGANIIVGGTVDGIDILAFHTQAQSYFNNNNSGVLTNGVTATTQSASDNSTKVATTAYTDTAIANLIDSSPSTLNTLNELASALGDDANFSTTVTNSIATKMPLAGGEFTGNITTHDVIPDSNAFRNIGTSSVKFNQVHATTFHGSGANLTNLPSQTDNNFTDADHSKLDGIEAGATADQTASEILTLIKTVDGDGSGLDADTLDGISSSSFLRSDANDTMSGNLTASGTLSLNGRVNIGNSLSRPAALDSDGDAHCRIGGSDVYLYVASLNASGGYKLAMQAARGSDFASFTLNLQANGGELQRGGHKVWDAGNDGSGSGLDSDTVDGIQASSFLRSDANDNASGTITFSDAKGIRLSHSNQVNSDDGKIAAGTHGSGLNIVGTRTLSSGNRQVRIWGDVITDAGATFWNSGNDGSGSGLDADLLDGVQGSSYLRSDANDTSSGTIAFGVGTLDPDSFTSHSGGFGGISDGGWGARGVFVHGGGTGDAAAMAHNGSGLYFGIQNGSSTNSMATWLQVTPGTRVVNFQTADNANNVQIGGNKIFHAGNDGSGSGLDADTLDGVQGSSYLRSDAADVMSQGTQGTATLDVRNTGGAGSGSGTGAIIATFKGDSDAIEVRNIAAGDYGIYNTQQNNGIELYDGGGGVRILYNGTIGVEFDSGNTYGDFKGVPTVNGTNLARVSDNITGTSGGFTAGNASNLNSGTLPTARLGTLPQRIGLNVTVGGTPASRNAFLALGDNDTGVAQNGDGQLELWANNQEIMNLDTGEIEVYKQLRPSSDSSFSLGTSSHRWSNLYADTLYGNGSNITNVDADTVDGFQAVKLYREVASASATVGGGWMTVAENTSGRKHGEIIVSDSDSGDHGFIRIDWMRSYMDSCFTVVNCGGHSNRITGVRVLRDSDDVYGNKKLQVYVTVSSTYRVQINQLQNQTGWGEHSVVTPVIQASISGYQVDGSSLEDLNTYNFSAEQGIQVGSGGMKSLGNVDITGNITVSGTVDGADVASMNSKLSGIESGATADQTASEILTLLKTVDGAGSGLDSDLLDGQSSAFYRSAGNINAGTLLAARLGTASTSEAGVSAVGNFGQYESHGTYTNFNTEPAYWGWNFVQGNANAPNTTSSQWYRCRLSLGSNYGKGSDSGDYSLEMALPRNSHSAAGVLHIRTIEAGSEGSWTTVGDNASLITTGTLPAARLPNHSASLLTSGTIPAARLSASDLLTKIKTVDGAGSGLDADLLDGTSSAGFFKQSGSWLGDLGSNGFTRENGLAMTGGAEFVILSKSGQGHVLIDGSYHAYEGGAFYSYQNSSFSSQVGFFADSTSSAKWKGHLKPNADSSQDLGSSSLRWNNLYVNDMHFSNEGGKNSVDSTWGDWTLQEGESDIFMINNRSGKKFKIAMIPV